MSHIVSQQVMIFNRYRQLGIPGHYVWLNRKFQVIGSGGYHFAIKASNDNATRH